jgi:hypothetical protein
MTATPSARATEAGPAPFSLGGNITKCPDQVNKNVNVVILVGQGVFRP